MMTKETLRAGDRVQVSINSGIDSEKWGIVKNVNPNVVGKDDAVVDLDNGHRIVIPKNRLIKEGEAWRPTFK